MDQVLQLISIVNYSQKYVKSPCKQTNNLVEQIKEKQ